MPRYPMIYERNRKSGQVAQPGNRKLLTVPKVMEKLDCSKSHVYRLISDGKLIGIKLGLRQGIRVEAGEVERFLNENIVTAE